MRRALLLLVSVAAALCGLVAPAHAADPVPCATRPGVGEYPNPLQECPAADPGMIIQGDTWYAYTTGLKLYKSTDAGHHWVDLGRFLTIPPGYVDAWAPEVKRIGGKYIAYFSMRPAPHTFAKIFVATSDNPETGWTLRPEPLVEFPDFSVIDVSPFRAPDGSLHLLYKEDIQGVNVRKIVIDDLSPDGMSVAGNPVEILHMTKEWEGNSVEGPTMIYNPHDQRYYLFYSGNSYTPYGHYAVGVARSRTLTGDFDLDKPEGPILQGDDHFLSPGHQFIATVKIHHHKHTMMFYHAYPLFDPQGNPLPTPGTRVLMMDELHWGSDGWPYVNDGTPSR